MTEKSLLDTPIVLEIPVSVPSSNNSGEGQLFFQVSLDGGKEWINLFNVRFENLIKGTEDLQEVKHVDNLEMNKTYYLYDLETNETTIEFEHQSKSGKDKEGFVFNENG
jgi:hypothetical protein